MNAIFGYCGDLPADALPSMASRLTHRGERQRLEHPAKDLFFGCGSCTAETCFYADDDFAVVCDAGIYNAAELRGFLAGRDIPVHSQSGAELILALFRDGGVASLEHINGDFAFALWDKGKKHLVLGRDYCGCRPLFFAPLSGGRGIAFASEYKALKDLPGVDAVPDRDMLQCLQYWKKLPVGRTLLKGVHAVLPGAVEIFSAAGGKIETRKMAPIQAKATLISEDDALREVRRALSKAISCRVSDPKRIGIALSGGIDSIGIAFICRSLFPSAEIHTFTAKAAQNDIEAELAGRVAQSIGARHHPVLTPPGLMRDHLEKLVWHLEDPVARSEALQLLKIGQAAGGHVASLLCGMEADALFAGMARHRIIRLMAKWPIARGVLGEIYNFTQNGLPPESTVGKLLVRLCLRNMAVSVPEVEGSSYRPSRIEFPREREQLVGSFLARTFQDGACQDSPKLERTFAAWSVRYQSPFLDRDLARVAFSIPDELKFNKGRNKYILRKALQAWVPDEFCGTPKRPQRMNYDAEFAGTLDQVADCYLREGSPDFHRIFNPSDISELRRGKPGGVRHDRDGMRLWTAVLTQIWYKQFACR